MLPLRIKQTKIFRLIVCALRIPFYYIVLRGHIRKRDGLSVNRQGCYVPWITYPAIDFLDNINFTDCSVFEFGSGSSSFWWSNKAKQVTSVEMDALWYEKIAEKLPDNVRLFNVENGGMYPESINKFKEKFDVVIVDGAERYKCVVCAISKISDRGIVILDNTEWYPNSARLLRDNGFVQLDFYGLPPSNSFPSITSIFYKSTELLCNRMEVTKSVTGGNVLIGGALDDS